jgi:hypothetical protein
VSHIVGQMSNTCRGYGYLQLRVRKASYPRHETPRVGFLRAMRGIPREKAISPRFDATFFYGPETARISRQHFPRAKG